MKRPQKEELTDLKVLLLSSLVGQYRLAVDGGAHIGGWTEVLSRAFEKVISFEPASDTFALLKAYVGRLPNVELRQEALLAVDCPVRMVDRKGTNALTARYALPDNAGDCKAIALDNLNLPVLDFLKLDLEGGEPLALVGALHTLKRCRPFVVVEEFGFSYRYGFSDGASGALLKTIGYRQVWEAGPNLGFAI